MLPSLGDCGYAVPLSFFFFFSFFSFFFFSFLFFVFSFFVFYYTQRLNLSSSNNRRPQRN